MGGLPGLEAGDASRYSIDTLPLLRLLQNMFRSKQNKITQKAQNVEKNDSWFKPYKGRKLFFH